MRHNPLAVTYTAEQIYPDRSKPPTPNMVWSVRLDDDRVGSVQVATGLYAMAEATDKDAYVAEAIADNLNRNRVPEEVVLAGTRLITRF
jgi:hypothetical protein